VVHEGPGITARFECVAWEAIAPHVIEACAEDLADIRADVQAGAAAAWRINEGDAWMICRPEVFEDRQELVVMVFQGRNLRAVAPDIIALAKGAGYGSIRFHTRRPGMIRMLSAFGFTEAERVYKAEL
jgi:hypothetical protein